MMASEPIKGHKAKTNYSALKDPLLQRNLITLPLSIGATPALAAESTRKKRSSVIAMQEDPESCEVILVRGFVVAGRAAGLAVHQSIAAEPNINQRLAEATKFFAIAVSLRLFALRATVFGGTGSGAHGANVARRTGDRKMT
jgi:hypothetical protein